MDSIESLGLVCFTGLFLLAYIAVFVAIAIVSTRAKQRSARQILKAQARGAFADMETPENKSRFRRLAVVSLIGLLGMVLSVVIVVWQWLSQASNLFGIAVAVGLISAVLASIAGLLMQREINRRL